MTSYLVASSDRGIGYVSCDDEWSPRLMHWRPFVVTDDGDNGIHWLPSSASRSYAEATVRAYLGVTRG